MRGKSVIGGLASFGLAAGIALSACGGSSGPTQTPAPPSSSQSAAYAGGYAFGYAAATTNGIEAQQLGRYYPSFPLRQACTDMAGVEGEPLNEAPPINTSPAFAQWVSGCVAGFNAGG